MPFGSVLRDLRKRNNMTQKQLSDILGCSESTVGMYERGQREPAFEMLEAIADYFNVDMDYLTGRSPIERMVSFSPPAPPPGFQAMPAMAAATPLIGDIACGTPILAEENISRYLPTPLHWHADFALLCRGDSMAPRILDGDLVAIRKVPQVENGQIAAVRIDDEATLKRCYRYPDRLVLQAENPAYEPIVLIGPEMSRATIEGIAVGFMRNL